MDIWFKRENHKILPDLYKIKLKLHHKKNSYRYWFTGLSAIAFLIAGIGTRKEFGSFWNLWSALSISFFYLFYVGVYQAIKVRRVGLNSIAQQIGKYKREGRAGEFIFTDSMVAFGDGETYFQANWSYFRYYVLYKDYFFLVRDTIAGAGVFAFGKAELPAGLFQELQNFAALKLPRMGG